MAIVGLTNEGDRGFEEQQIRGDENAIRPYPLSAIFKVIHRSSRKTSVADEPG